MQATGNRERRSVEHNDVGLLLLLLFFKFLYLSFDRVFMYVFLFAYFIFSKKKPHPSFCLYFVSSWSFVSFLNSWKINRTVRANTAEKHSYIVLT